MVKKPFELINQGSDFLTVVARGPLTIAAMVSSLRLNIEFFQ